MRANSPVTLADFANAAKYPVIFWASVGTPYGEHTPVGCEDVDVPDEWDNLTGTVKGRTWEWDGQGAPTDGRRNSVTTMTIRSDSRRWHAIVRAWNRVTTA